MIQPQPFEHLIHHHSLQLGKMRFTPMLLASAALTAPIVERKADPNPQLLNDLSPDVATLLTGLGLGDLAVPVGGTVDTLGTDVKVKRRLLNDLSPDVVTLLTGLGLGSVAVPVGGVLNTAGTDVKAKRQLLNDLSPGVVALLTGLGLGSVAVPVGGILDTTGTDVSAPERSLA
jgi:hypothetical protein